MGKFQFAIAVFSGYILQLLLSFANRLYTLYVIMNIDLIKSDTFLSLTSFIGNISGVTLFCFLSEVIGRKRTLIGIFLTLIVSFQTGLFFKYYKNYILLCVIGITKGMSFGGAYTVLPIYISEISEKFSRGMFISLSQSIYILADVMIGNVIPHVDTDIISDVINYMSILLSLLTIIAFGFLANESPLYYIGKGRDRSAQKTSTDLRSIHDDTQLELDDLQNTTEDRIDNGRHNEKIMTCLKSNGFMKGVVIMISLIILQALCGIHVLRTYLFVLHDVSPSLKIYMSLLIGFLQANIKADSSTLPTFQTSSQVFKVTDKDTVVLPCEVSNAGPYKLVWKKGIAVLSAGNVKVTPDTRVNLVHGYSLEIKNVGPQDAGDYVCQIGTLEPREITHTVEILVPPRIHYVTSNGRVEVKKGSSVKLECKASGNPPPKVTWSRKNNLLPDGVQTAVTPVLSLDRVDRHQAGVYQCTANNGVGEDVSEQIVLHVLYPPEISVERPVVHTAEGFEAQLVCIVHGESQPEVLWYRDTMQLDTTERRIMESRGSRHTLVIRKVHRSDFGNYTCVADNQLGKTRKSVQLTGKPNPAKFSSASRGSWKDSYNISWAVESLSPIEEYKLLFRRLPDSGTSEDGHPQPLHHQSQRKFGLGKENKTYASVGYSVGYGYGRQFVDRRTDWRDVILPAAPTQSPGVQSMSYVIRGLESGQNYEAKVQARNKFGWSPISEAFTFQTTDTDMSYPDRPQSPKHVYNEHDIHQEILGISLNTATASSCSCEILILSMVSIIFYKFIS